MLSKRSSKSVLSTIVVMSALAVGCGGAEDEAPPMNAGNGGASGASGNGGSGGTGGSGGAGGTSGTSGEGGTSGTSGTGGTSGAGSSGMSGSMAGTGVIPGVPTKEERFPEVQDWAALDVVYDTTYSAFDGVHPFKVPYHVNESAVALGDWFSVPEGAVSFDEDPDLVDMGGGVIATIVEYHPEITIGVQSGMLGGTAPLFVTEATEEQWVAGEARYDNGIDFEFPELTAAEFALLLLDPEWSPPPPPENCSCISCHSTGAKYFEVQHTPTQAARFSDDELIKILTEGMKPAGIGFRILPDMLGDKTAEQIYADYHTWETMDETELKGLVVYLRSLAPTGQGDIKLPDGSYVEPGTMPMMP
jgi:hypothetical protein